MSQKRKIKNILLVDDDDGVEVEMKKRKISLKTEIDKELKETKSRKSVTKRVQVKRVKNEAESESDDEVEIKKRKISLKTETDTELKKTKTRKSITKRGQIKSESKVNNSKKSNTKKINSVVESHRENDEKSIIKSEGTWFEHELLAERENIPQQTAQVLIDLFKNDNTIPFIARYRRHLTNDMNPEKLRDVKESYEEICSLLKKATNVIKTIEKTGKLTDELKFSIESCKTIDELEHIYAPYKTGNKRTLAERAKSLGLEDPALNLLTGSEYVSLNSFINDSVDGLKHLDEVNKGVIHIIAHKIATDTELLEFVRKLRKEIKMIIETKNLPSQKLGSKAEELKFQNYFDFKIPVAYIKPHQVLAINRGENLKILSVKVVIPDYAFNKFKYFCENKWLSKNKKYKARIDAVVESVKDAYKRLISPLMIRQTRAELKTMASKASVEVFSANLKKMLLGSPLKGKCIMGIDPGFQVGCKVAVVSRCGDLLGTGVIYPNSNKSSKRDSELIKELLMMNDCNLVALGNGTACRETETWLTDLIKSNYFRPLDVSYTIVSECGASIYSCGEEAKKEFPKLDPLLISAVSLARRVQDPLSEMVKVEPQHLGVGMYQHDINKTALQVALDEVVSECVSFVGVDVNTASHCLLRRTAGLTALRADNILKFRAKQGPFTSRFQLKDVKGIGEKIFKQFAGFIRVGPSNSEDAKEFYERPDTNPLDCTWIHPESYDVAEKIMIKFGLRTKEVGQSKFIAAFTKSLHSTSIQQLSEEFEASEATVKLITEVLSRPLDHDMRKAKSQEPVFKKEITSINDISVGSILKGWVQNVTHFGAFVDVGVGTNGLLHHNAMSGSSVDINDRIEVKVLNLDLSRKRIGLALLQKL